MRRKIRGVEKFVGNLLETSAILTFLKKKSLSLLLKFPSKTAQFFSGRDRTRTCDPILVRDTFRVMKSYENRKNGVFFLEKRYFLRFSFENV